MYVGYDRHLLRLSFAVLFAACSSGPVETPQVQSQPLGDAATTQLDATTPPDAGRSDALVDAKADATAVSPSAGCTVDAMTKLYAGALPTNPYANQPNAGACVSKAHDAIILLGCPSNTDGSAATCQTKRADMAVALSRAGYADRFIVSGAAAHNKYVEADALAALLVARGVAADHILKDPLAEHTDENIYYSSRIMQAQGWTTAIVASDDPGHLIMTGVCDANCCVDLGRLTVFDFAVTGGTTVAGHYVLYPNAATVSKDECKQIEQTLKIMCTNMSTRKACASDFKLSK